MLVVAEWTMILNGCQNPPEVCIVTKVGFLNAEKGCKRAEMLLRPAIDSASRIPSRVFEPARLLAIGTSNPIATCTRASGGRPWQGRLEGFLVKQSAAKRPLEIRLLWLAPP